MFPSLVFTTSMLWAPVSADHQITLLNNCNFAVGMTLSNFPHNSVDFTSPPIPDIAAQTSFDLTVPTGWSGSLG
ncbi:hypothetical protein K438DRAFT_1971773 [Mycena galopus ATCC 62051]|nr:hypothetical protein K438DRAFT_1971773 [Mycena galopus ATCC 62051]